MTRNGDRASGSRKDGQGSVVPELVVEGVERGWSVIPVRGDKTPCLNSWKRWQGERPTLQQVEAWQRKFNPPAWAVVTGSVSDVIILDFDGAEGRRTCEATGLEPHIQTGSGGYHVYV